jgi:hypothetical protein
MMIFESNRLLVCLFNKHNVRLLYRIAGENMNRQDKKIPFCMKGKVSRG